MKKYLILLIAILLGGPSLLYGQSDIVLIMPPNAMIIFDTSASMNSKTDGTAANASWKEVDVDGNVKPSGTPPYTWYLFEGSGNHPDSKLYQAKLALKKVIKDLVDINLGFSTYAQFKTPAMVGLYKRDRWLCTGGQTGSPATCTRKKLYWRWNKYSHTYSSTSSLQLGSFTDKWGQSHTGMVMGSTLTEPNHLFDNDTVSPSGNSVPPQYTNPLTYTINGIVLNAEMNYYTYTYTSDAHNHYEEQFWSVSKNPSGCLADCSNCSNSDCSSLIDCSGPSGDFKNPWQGGGGWKTYYIGGGSYTQDPEYSPKWRCYNPTFSCAAAVTCSYTLPKTTDWAWGGGGTTSCPNNAGGAWNPFKNPALGDSWTDWIYDSNCYDASSFTYPSQTYPLNNNYPNTWSYFHIQGGIWRIPLDQPSPFYPSKDASNNINDTPGTFDNHYFFINIPKADDSTNGYANKNAILALLDLTPVKNPQTGNWWTKLPLKPNSLTANTSGTPVNQTPIADSLDAAKRYFYDYINTYMGGDAPSKAKCRGNYIILLTDGLESDRFKDPPTNLNPDFDAGATAAMDLYNNGVSTFVIGFGSAAGANINALNKIARAGSNNVYDAFFTATLADLTKAIQTIFQIIKGSYTRSNPVVARDRSRVYKGYFNFPGYEGHLAAFDVNTDGTIKTPEVWDAGVVMNSNGRGTVSTWVPILTGPFKGDFKDVDLTGKAGKKLAKWLNPFDEDIDGDGNVDKMDSKTIVNFTLDANYDDCAYLPPAKCHGPGYYKGVRSGKWLLGDIIHSTPTVVGDPVFNFPDAAFTKKYSTFKSTWKGNRETIVYVGANDGMLHAFSDVDGKEKFGIIPNNLLGKLKELRTNTHQFFVDSSPKAYDVFFGGAWRTVLVSGERGGGNYYFALDVTDPKDSNYPEVLWDLTDPGMGDTWSRPEIGWVRLSGQEKFVAFVGGGYTDPTKPIYDNIGNTFYVIDISDGSILRKFIVGGQKNKVPAGATAFDSDLDGRVNGVYFGDINGVLWKIKIDGEEDINNWQLIKLYTPSTTTPVFYPPAVTKNNQDKIMVYYGQGDETNVFEQTSSNSFFEIYDDPVLGKGVKIWEESFGAGEKVLAAPGLGNNVVYFTTWVYTGTAGDCGAGKGKLYGITMTSQGVAGDIGALVLDPITGTPFGPGNNKKYFNITDYFPSSMGIPSAPIVTNGMIYLSTSLNAAGGGGGPGGSGILNIPVPGWGTGRLKYWREVF
jgi:hypothetical protein